MFDWDQANIGHLARHNVKPNETEEVIANHPLDVSYEDFEDEQRFRQVGETASGRLLVVLSTERRGLTRVITAHDPSQLLRSAYLTYRRKLTHASEDGNP